MEKIRSKSTTTGRTSRTFFTGSRHLPPMLPSEIGPNFVPPIRTFCQRPMNVSPTSIRSANFCSTPIRSTKSFVDFNQVDGEHSEEELPPNSNFSAENCSNDFRPPQMSRRKILQYLFDKSSTVEPFSSPIRVRKNAVFSRTNVVKSLVEKEKVRTNDRKSEKLNQETVTERKKSEKEQTFLETLRPKLETKFHKILSNFKAKCSIVIFSMPKGK